jgi:hypothetical protein
MKPRYNLFNWLKQKLFSPPAEIKCLRCGANLRTPSGLDSICPTCGLEYGFTGAWEPRILIGELYTAANISDAEDVAKEHGIQLPPWPKA